MKWFGYGAAMISVATVIVTACTALGIIMAAAGGEMEIKDVVNGALAVSAVLAAVVGVAFLTVALGKMVGKNSNQIYEGIAVIGVATLVVAACTMLGRSMADIGATTKTKDIGNGALALGAVLAGVAVVALGIIGIGALVGGTSAVSFPALLVGIAVIGVAIFAIHMVMRIAERMVDLIKEVNGINKEDLADAKGKIAGPDGIMSVFGDIISSIINMNVLTGEGDSKDKTIAGKFFANILGNMALPGAIISVFAKSAMFMMALVPVFMMINIVKKFSDLRYYNPDTKEWEPYKTEDFKQVSADIASAFSTFITTIIGSFKDLPEDNENFNRKTIRKIKKLMGPVGSFIDIANKFAEGKWVDEEGVEHKDFNQTFIDASKAIAEGFSTFVNSVTSETSGIKFEDVNADGIRSVARMMKWITAIFGAFGTVDGEPVIYEYDGKTHDFLGIGGIPIFNKDQAVVIADAVEGMKKVVDAIAQINVLAASISTIEAVRDTFFTNTPLETITKNALPQIHHMLGAFGSDGTHHFIYEWTKDGYDKTSPVDLEVASESIGILASTIQSFSGINTTYAALDEKAFASWDKASQTFVKDAKDTISTANSGLKTLQAVDKYLKKSQKDRKQQLEELAKLWRDVGEAVKESSKAMNDMNITVQQSSATINNAVGSGKEEKQGVLAKIGTVLSGKDKNEAQHPQHQPQPLQSQQQVQQDLMAAMQDSEKQILIKIDNANGVALIKALMQYI